MMENNSYIRIFFEADGDNPYKGGAIPKDNDMKQDEQGKYAGDIVIAISGLSLFGSKVEWVKRNYTITPKTERD